MNWVSANETLGIRIPKNNFTKLIQESNTPFITTSVNLSGEPPALSLREINSEIKAKADIIIDAKDFQDENLIGKPSILIINGKEIERK